jgi:hypothetical protein
MWQLVEKFYAELEPKGCHGASAGSSQLLDWMDDLIQDELRRRFDHDRRVVERLPAVRQSLLRGDVTAVHAARQLLDAYDQRNESQSA